MEEIRRKLLNDGINYALVMKMTDEELKKSQTFDDYYDYDNYLLALALKYDI